MIIQQPLLFQGSLGSATLTAVFDSGAGLSFINANKAKGLGVIEKLPHPIKVGQAATNSDILVTEKITLFFTLNELELEDNFYLFPELADEVLIGVPTMQKWHITLDPTHNQIITDPKAVRLRV